jgi:hypothetical protein
LNRGPTVYETPGGALVYGRKRQKSSSRTPAVPHLAAELRSRAGAAAESIRRGDPHRDARALDLIEAAIDLVLALESSAEERGRSAG